MARFSPQNFGKYFLVDKIATGGMAEIFKAKTYAQGGFENLVVIKRILPHVGANEDFVEMFIDEAKVSVALQHPNIVRVFDFGNYLDDYFIAMECVDGKDVRNILRKHVKSNATFDPSFAAYIAHETCKGLHYAHTKSDAQGRPYGIVHRDISPSNVLVGYDGQVKVADFGIAKAESNAYQTQDGVLKGKFEYMSPEQAEGRPLDARSDVFAVGILLWEMLTGHRLFKTDSDIATLKAIQAVDVPLPQSVDPEIPDALQAIVMKALSGPLDARYQSAGEMAEALRNELAPAGPDGVRVRLQAYLEGFFDDEIREERERLMANSVVAERLRDETEEWEGQTTSMRPPTQPQVVLPAPRLWPVVALLVLVLMGTVGIAVVGLVVAVNLQAEAVAEVGDVEVVVEPDARVYVDDVLRGTGTTVLVSRIDVGEHTVRLEADGHVTEELRVSVPEGDAVRVEAVLAPVKAVEPVAEPEVAPQPVVPRPIRPRPVSEPETETPAATPPKISIRSTPAGAAAFVDGSAVGTTPVTVEAAPGQAVAIRLELEGHTSISGSVTAGDAGSTESFSRSLPVADSPGRLTVLLVGGGWAHVYVDGKKLSKTAPLKNLELAAGTHEVRVANEGLGIDHEQTVEVTSGGSVTVRAAPN